MRIALRWLGQVITWLIILAVTGVLLVAVVIPRISGATPYAVLTGSMRPELPPGTLVVVKPVEQAEVGIGDVVTYQLESGKPTVVTHRVVAISASTTGEPRFTTQGDANDVPDEKLVRPEQIRGELWYAVPYLGHLNDLLTVRQRQWVVYAVASMLLGYAAFMLVGAMRDRRRPSDSTTTEAKEEDQALL